VMLQTQPTGVYASSGGHGCPAAGNSVPNANDYRRRVDIIGTISPYRNTAEGQNTALTGLLIEAPLRNGSGASSPAISKNTIANHSRKKISNRRHMPIFV